MERTEIIEKLIDQKWSSKRKFADHIGIPPTTLQSILKRGVGNASIDNVIRVCRGLGITVDQLERMAKIKDANFVAESGVEYSTSKEHSYFYYPITVAAGIPEIVDGLSEEEIETIKIPDSVMGKWSRQEGIFLTKVNGDSMNRVIPHNSLIAVKEFDLLNIKDGDIVVYSYDNEYSVKRIYKLNDRLIFRPDSTENHYTDNVVTMPNDSLKVHGKVVVYIVELD